MPRIEADNESFDLRVESRFKNAVLYNALYARFGKPVIATASMVIGVRPGKLSALLCLRANPFFRDGTYRPVAVTIAEYLDQQPEDVFPASLYALNLPRVVVREFSSPQVISLQEAAAQKLLPASMSGDDNFTRREALYESLSHLTPRQEKVLKLRFGLDGLGERTLDELGQEFGVGKERIRQIEAKALRMLRHPSISTPLRKVLND